MQRGDVYVLNDPYHGGTHLPDMTVVTPVYLEDGDAQPGFFVASRGHHADIGGITPGSMPPFSAGIGDEGVLIDNFKLIEGGTLREDELRALLMGGPHPVAQSATRTSRICARKSPRMSKRCRWNSNRRSQQFGRGTVAAYMRHVQDNAEESVRRVISALKDGEFTLPLDNGAQIHVNVRVDLRQRSAFIDFNGTSAAIGQQLQCAALDHHGGRAVCVPHPGRRRYSA